MMDKDFFEYIEQAATLISSEDKGDTQIVEYALGNTLYTFIVGQGHYQLIGKDAYEYICQLIYIQQQMLPRLECSY